jgi:hypothetical protein
VKLCRAVLCFFVVLALAACASNSNQISNKMPPGLGKVPVYAKLVSAAGLYRFGELSFTKPNGAEPWVLLNTLSPAFETKVEKNCFIGTGLLLGADKGQNCKTANEAQFRTASMGTLQAVAKGVTTALTYGLTGTNRMVDVTFDRAAYDAAISQAEAALGVPRAELLQEVDEGVARMSSANDAYKTDGGRVKVKLSVADDSGFFSDGDVDFTKLAVLRYATMPKIENVSSIHIEDGLSRARVRELFSEIIDKANQGALANYSVQCSATSARGFRFVMTCPASIQRVAGSQAELPLRVRVSSRDFADVRPKTFAAVDKSIRANLEGDRLIITNLTQSYIKIEAVSFYYQNKISTKQGDAISLPPLAENDSVRFSSFSHQLPSQERNAITRQSRKSNTVQFGIAIKYSVQGQGDFTLFKDQVMPELDLLSAQTGH